MTANNPQILEYVFQVIIYHIIAFLVENILILDCFCSLHVDDNNYSDQSPDCHDV